MQASKVEVGQHFKLATEDRILKRLAYDNGVYGVDANNNLVGVHPDSSCELVGATKPTTTGALAFTIRNPETDAELVGTIQVSDRGIDVLFGGFGTHGMEPGFGSPVFIEADKNGNPLVYCWAEIDSEDHTHKISLHGARDNRVSV
jgi:hypothetical protein